MALRIVEDRLEGDSTISVKNISAPFYGTIRPEILVIHYGVVHDLPSLVAAQKARGYWAHLSIDGSAEIGAHVVQSLPFFARGSHAGASSYRGRDSVSSFSIGLEIANPGPLIERGGRLFTVYGKEWPREQAIEIRHRLPTPPEWTHWATYSDQEIGICVEICNLLRDELGIRDVVGHDEISPDRKRDPGPAFPIDWLRERTFGK